MALVSLSTLATAWRKNLSARIALLLLVCLVPLLAALAIQAVT